MDCYVFDYTFNFNRQLSDHFKARSYYDALDAEDKADAEEITQ